MGVENSKELSEEEIECVQKATQLDRTKIMEGYESFNTFTSLAGGTESLDLETVKQLVPTFIGPFKENLIERMFSIFDQDKNGHIDFKEFMIGTTLLSLKDAKALAKLVFKIGDYDNSDGIDRDEFEKLALIYIDMEERNEYEVNELKKKFADIIDSSFQKLDADKKGYLNEQEFGQAFLNVIEDKSFGMTRFSEKQDE